MSTFKTVSFFHKDTGMFNGVHFMASDASIVVLNTPPDHIAIEGRYDSLSQRIDVSSPSETLDEIISHDGTRVKFNEAEHSAGYNGRREKRTVHKVIDYQPPPPSVDHVWDSSPKRWQLGAAAQAKAAARSAAIARIAELEASQHPHVRELLLGSLSARPRLQAIHDEILSLQATLDS